jgi:hypothetical protein
MAEEKKPKAKIDLKARLGKTQTGMGSSVPLPVPGAAPSSQPGASSPPTADGVPPPAVPVAAPSVRPSGGGLGPGLSPGIPLPPFAQRPSQREAAPKPTAAQQTIKVEVGEEIHAERKKATQRMILFSGIAAVVGIGIGIAVGGLRERSARGDLAVKAAGDLEKEVKAANEKIKELGEKLVEADEALKNKKYPAELVGALSGINIPFETANIETKPGASTLKVLKPLLKYATAVQDLNESKNKLQGFLTQAKVSVEKAWAEEKDPVFNFSVTFRNEPGKGMVAELFPVKDAFKVGAEFPKEFTIIKTEMQQGQAKNVDKKVKRWEKGDLTGSDPLAIPVHPTTTAFLSEKVVFQLRAQIARQRDVIEGEFKGTPQETLGVFKDGENLAIELHKIALAR